MISIFFRFVAEFFWFFSTTFCVCVYVCAENLELFCLSSLRWGERAMQQLWKYFNIDFALKHSSTSTSGNFKRNFFLSSSSELNLQTTTSTKSLKGNSEEKSLCMLKKLWLLLAMRKLFNIKFFPVFIYISFRSSSAWVFTHCKLYGEPVANCSI